VSCQFSFHRITGGLEMNEKIPQQQAQVPLGDAAFV
jgi:hypothetical protein